MHHDSIAVYLYFKKLIAYIQAKINSSAAKIVYITDGSGSQYKNKYNFINLTHHADDYRIEAMQQAMAKGHVMVLLGAH